LNGESRSAAECAKPRSFPFLKLSKDSSLEVYYGGDPHIIVFGGVVGGCKYCHLCFLDFLPMGVFHLVIFCKKKPAVLVTKANDFRIFDVLLFLARCVFEPFGKSLHGESSRPQTSGYRLSREAIVEKENAFLTPLFDVCQCAGGLGVLSPSRGQSLPRCLRSFPRPAFVPKES